jgi:TonB family protein
MFIASTLNFPETTVLCSFDESEFEKPKILETTPPSISFGPGNKEQSVKVVVSLIIDSDGVVSRFKIIEAPNEAIAQSIIDAIKKWKFEPAKYYDVYVPSRVYIQIDLPYSPDKISLWLEWEKKGRQQFNNSKK